jgi:hypothetical protein
MAVQALQHSRACVFARHGWPGEGSQTSPKESSYLGRNRIGRNRVTRLRRHHTLPPAFPTSGEEQITPKLQIQQAPETIRSIFLPVQMSGNQALERLLLNN